MPITKANDLTTFYRRNLSRVGTRVFRIWTDNPIVCPLFEDVRRPTGGAGHHEYRREEFRVAMAKRYLSETSLPANEVTVLVGYSDPADLYRMFHRETGQTPLQYRARLES